MAIDMAGLLADLRAETTVVTDLVTGVDDDVFDLPTPSVGWTIRDQVSHLAYFDQAAVLAAKDPARFRAEAAELLRIGTTFPDEVARRFSTMPAAELRSWFEQARTELLDVFGSIDPTTRLPWYGPDMSAASSVTARLMETWAHGQDIADTLGVTREAAGRLRHIAHLGVRTFGFAHQLRGLEVPQVPVRVELTGPDGDTWEWGPPDAKDRVSGSALDFCLVVTQRRNLADTGIAVTGPVATAWMSIAQAFAGAPGPGRPPGKFSAEVRSDG